MKLESEGLQSLVDAYRAEHTLDPEERRTLEKRLQPRSRPRSAWRWSLVGAAAAAAVLLFVVLIRGRSAQQAHSTAPVEASDRAVVPTAGGPVLNETRTFTQPRVQTPSLPRRAPDSDSPPRPQSPSPTPRAPRATQEPKAPEPGPAQSTVSELELIATAQESMRVGRPAEALDLLEQHRRHFPDASTREERRALRVLALCALGRLAEGRGARSVFLKTFPASAYRERVAGACEEESKP